MKAIVATFIILFATGAAAQDVDDEMGLATITKIVVSIGVTDKPQCRVRVDGLQDEAELGLRRSGFQVVADGIGTGLVFEAKLRIDIVLISSHGCVAAAYTQMSTGVFRVSYFHTIDVWEGPLAVITSSDEVGINRMVRNYVRDGVVSVSNAILKAREELPQCANAAAKIPDNYSGAAFDAVSLMWERCVEEALWNRPARAPRVR